MNTTMARLLRTVVARELANEPADNAGLVEHDQGFVPSATVRDALAPSRAPREP